MLPSIGAGSSSTPESIEAPAGEEYLPRGDGADTAKTSEKRLAAAPRGTRVLGSFEHPILPMPPVSLPMLNTRVLTNTLISQRKTMIPAMDFLSCYAIAVNEVNASGGRIVTSPTVRMAALHTTVLAKVFVERCGRCNSCCLEVHC